MGHSTPEPGREEPAAGVLETTGELLTRARGGDARARDRLLSRYMPALRRWAHGRLPAAARDLVDTDDLVQVTLFGAFQHLEDFEPRREGAFFAYLRQILLNKLRDQARRVRRRPGHDELPENLVDHGPSPIEEVLGRQALERYEAALARLTPAQQESIALRVELGFSYPALAEAMGHPSANAARMALARALVRLAEEMHER